MITGETVFHAVNHDVDVHVDFACDAAADADTRVVVTYDVT